MIARHISFAAPFDDRVVYQPATSDCHRKDLKTQFHPPKLTVGLYDPDEPLVTMQCLCVLFPISPMLCSHHSCWGFFCLLRCCGYVLRALLNWLVFVEPIRVLIYGTVGGGCGACFLDYRLHRQQTNPLVKATRFEPKQRALALIVVMNSWAFVPFSYHIQLSRIPSKAAPRCGVFRVLIFLLLVSRAPLVRSLVVARSGKERQS